ncbi:hypothetical protein ACWD25_44425, partial [Streptomyces sp. NPDC002920]
ATRHMTQGRSGWIQGHRRGRQRVLRSRGHARPEGRLRKRAEGLRHVQAVLALARRRVDVLWAMLRDHRLYAITPPTAPAHSRHGVPAGA